MNIKEHKAYKTEYNREKNRDNHMITEFTPLMFWGYVSGSASIGRQTFIFLCSISLQKLFYMEHYGSFSSLALRLSFIKLKLFLSLQLLYMALIRNIYSFLSFTLSNKVH